MPQPLDEAISRQAFKTENVASTMLIVLQEEEEQISLSSTSSTHSASTRRLAKKTTQTLIYDVKNAELSTMKYFIDKLESGEQESTDKLLARATYSSCTPLNWTENQYWKIEFNKIRPAMKLPSHLLDEEYHRVQTKVRQKINEFDSLTLVSDGWTDMKGNPLLNFVVFASPEPLFSKAIETKTKSHTAQYMIKVVGEGLVTDHASNIKCALTILKKYPHLITFGCLGHGLNLLAKDICKLNTVDRTVESVKNKHTTSQVLKQIQQERQGTVHQSPLNRQEEEELMKIFRQRKGFCFHCVQHATCLLDPKQKDSMLTEEETSMTIQTISDIAETISDVDAGVVLGNLTEYKAEHNAWSRKAIWNAANNTSHVTWWRDFHGPSPLAKTSIQQY
ncbi:hypothetical protein PR048_012499, partial [Dryococelus australis]